MKNFLKLDDAYYIIKQEIEHETSEIKSVSKSTNHIFVVDVSGSMGYDLPLIRKQLKNKLSNLMKDGDTISIIWFSGKNESGILKEEVEVKSLKTLSDLHTAIDKWLVPIGLTAFQKPLELAKEVVDRIRKNRPDSVFSLMFLTDGWNNACQWNDVLTALKALEPEISSSTMIEYGMYADSQKLTQMATILGGEKISTSNFDDFEPVFEKKLSTSSQSTKKISIQIDSNYLYDFVFSVTKDGSVNLYNISESNTVLVGTDVNEIYYFSSVENGVTSFRC